MGDATSSATSSVEVVLHVPFLEDLAWMPVWNDLLFIFVLALGLAAGKWALDHA